LGLVALLAACVLLARDLRARPSTYFASGGSGVVVLDLSTSVDPARYRRLARVLRTFVETGQPVGLVTYSDTAYEMIPPGTRGEELRPILRFFEPPARAGGAQPGRRSRGFGFLESPWSGTFRGGTRISTGLGVARRVLERDGVIRGSVLLISDLDDSPLDLQALTTELTQYQRDGLRLRVVPLFPGDADREFFVTLVGREAFLATDELLANTALEEERTLEGSFPIALVACSGFLLLLLACNEHVCRRLRWRERRAV
ncbi:MAG: vWA domain-containing protein, partial [Gaiellaceae bacterium]